MATAVRVQSGPRPGGAGGAGGAGAGAGGARARGRRGARAGEAQRRRPQRGAGGAERQRGSEAARRGVGRGRGHTVKDVRRAQDVIASNSSTALCSARAATPTGGSSSRSASSEKPTAPSKDRIPTLRRWLVGFSGTSG